MKALEDLEAAFAAATTERLEVIVDPQACFHGGNRVSVVAVDKSNSEEVVTPTVAEFWPTVDDTDVADANLYVLMHNSLPALIECAERLREAQEALDVLAEDASEAGFPGRAEDAATLAMECRAALAKLENAK